MSENDHIHKTSSKRIVCKNGESVSAQASYYAYSTPRANSGPYSEVECGFPSVLPPLSWIEYAEEKDKLLDTIYPYLPIELLIKFIDANGGLDVEATLQILLSVEKYIDECDLRNQKDWNMLLKQNSPLKNQGD